MRKTVGVLRVLPAIQLKKCIQEIEVLFVDGTRPPRPALLLPTFQLKEQANMWIEMNIGVQLEAFQPERVGRVGSVAPVVIQNILIHATEFAA